jgi:hypothetical protein
MQASFRLPVTRSPCPDALYAADEEVPAGGLCIVMRAGSSTVMAMPGARHTEPVAASGPVREPCLGPLNERWALAVASELLPGLDRGRASLESGVEHVVVVAPEAGVVRISRAWATGR